MLCTSGLLLLARFFFSTGEAGSLAESTLETVSCASADMVVCGASEAIELRGGELELWRCIRSTFKRLEVSKVRREGSSQPGGRSSGAGQGSVTIVLFLQRERCVSLRSRELE